ncbi:MAG: tRNA (guanosine(46)-N7)-methyltransferase TrmB [Gammaproteobacteria bacterium]|nr:tRNA (guanosine(46)-N7)-methyltransferase TrmB [Gammaproteobacteria bacterium]
MTRADPDRTAEPPVRRHVRSFVRRAGRVTERQQRALETLRPRYGVDLPEPPEAVPPGFWPEQFGRTGPLTLEIGFGMGHSLLEMAEREPERLFVGVEVHPPGIGALMAGLEERGLDNVRVLEGDAVAVLDRAFAPGELDRVQIFFPDPWPKKRHHKRRIVQPAFLEQLARRVAPGGRLMLATDWEPYAEWMREAIEAAPSWRNAGGADGFVPRPAERPPTRFETRGERRGHRIRDLLAERV